jgi:hypothetical protein
MTLPDYEYPIPVGWSAVDINGKRLSRVYHYTVADAMIVERAK